MDNPLCSVIVPSCNSETYIHQCLHSISQQTYKNTELIVVDNFSKDNTRAVAERYGALVYTKGPERASQLNYGIRKAKGKYVFETGSDMTADPTYIEDCVFQCESKGYDAIYSSVLSKYHDNFWSRVKGLERQCYIGSNLIEAAHFFRRQIFYEIGGFDIKIVGVEEDMQYRMDKAGYKTGRIKAREVHLSESSTLKDVAKKAFYYGQFILYYLKRRPLRSTTYLFPLRPAFLRHWFLFISHPLLSGGFLVYKAVQLSCGVAGMVFGGWLHIKLHKEIYGKSSTDKSSEKPA